jgi:hypothetical protein
MMQKLSFLLFFLLLFFGCAKDYSENVQSDMPVFMANFSVSDSSYQLIAGKDNYYMYTDYYMDTLQVLNAVGSFSKTTCIDSVCPKTLRFELRNTDLSGTFFNANSISNISTFYQEDALFDSLQLGRASIIWTDWEGIQWKTNAGQQAFDSYFNILSVSPYESNEKNQATYLLEVNFKGLLYNALGAFMPIKGTGIIAIGVP